MSPTRFSGGKAAPVCRIGCIGYESWDEVPPVELEGMTFGAPNGPEGRRREAACDVLPKTRGISLFMRGLQPGRQPQATPRPLSTDMMMKVEAPYPLHKVS